MHDFCFTIPYGMLLMVGGSMGYFKKGSIASLAGGAGTGLLVLIAGFITLKAFEKKKKSPVFAVILQTVISSGLTFVMGQRYMKTQKVMPAGLVSGISGLMTCFYLYKIATGGNHIPIATKKAE